MRRLPDLCAVVPPATGPAQLNTAWDLTISRLLQHIVSLLSTPKVEPPLIWAMAQQYVNNRGAFDDEARRRTSAFAMGHESAVLPRDIPSLFSLAAYNVDTLADVPWQLHEAVNLARVLKKRPKGELKTPLSTSPISDLSSTHLYQWYPHDNIPSLFSLAASKLETLAHVPQILHATVNNARKKAQPNLTSGGQRLSASGLDPSTL